MAEASTPQAQCIFCQIASKSTSTALLHADKNGVLLIPDSHRIWIVTQDDRVVAFQDIKPASLRHYLVIPVAHIPTVKDLHRRAEHYSLVSHMLEVGRMLLQQDAPHSRYRFGFHQPPLNSVNHLHLHCQALPYIPRWKYIKYLSLGPVGFIEAEKLLEKIKLLPQVTSKV